MTRRIFRSICLAVFGVLIVSFTLLLFVLYSYFGGVQRDGLRVQTEFAAHAVANEGMAYFTDLDASSYRITWIDGDGDVLYDNRSNAAEMTNHLEREEIKEALESGEGESSRYSATLLERSLYCAKRLPDGSVIRLSVSGDTPLTLVFGMAQPIAIIIVLAVGLSLVLASRLSKRIVKPLNDLDLENPLCNEEYEELSPLLLRLASQQREIRWQQSELERKRQEFATVTENMTEGIILLNTQGQVLAINQAAKRLFGITAPGIGRDLLSFNDSPQMKSLMKSAASGLRDEKTVDFGDDRYQLLLSPVKNDDVLSGSVLLAVNVTEKEKAERLRREFTANVSHELKTPLHTIAGSAELLVNGVVKEQDKMDFYVRIHSEAQRMIRLVEDIIHLSHLDEGAEDMPREKTDLFKVAAEVVEALQVEADHARVTLNMEGESAIVTGIPQLLSSLVFNLVDNSIKYNRACGSVSVTVKNESEGAVLTVADTGIGIPPEHQERVFERFYRVDKSRSKELGGTGLGLSIVKHVAMLHQARIDLESVVEGGTTITVTFPF